MGTFRSLEDINAWMKAREFARIISDYIITKRFKNDFPLSDQINRSSGSIMDNIAEGFGREGTREFIQFLGVAKGSATEARSQLYRALDRNYINQKEFAQLTAMLEDITKMIGGLMNYLQTSGKKGNKYHVEEPLSIYGHHQEIKFHTHN